MFLTLMFPSSSSKAGLLVPMSCPPFCTGNVYLPPNCRKHDCPKGLMRDVPDYLWTRLLKIPNDFIPSSLKTRSEEVKELTPCPSGQETVLGPSGT